MNGFFEYCNKCKAGYYLDLNNYKCVLACPSNTKPIISKNSLNFINTNVQYCRPYLDEISFKYQYYVDSESVKYIELGTIEYPFKNLDYPYKEVFNFMYEKTTDVVIFLKRNTSYKIHHVN